MKKSLALALALLLVLAMGVFTPAQAAPALNDGLIYHFDFEDDINNSGSRAIQGTAEGTVKFETGKVGKAASFDGTQQIHVPNVEAVKSLSVSVWINIPTIEKTGEGFSGTPYAILSTTAWGNGAVHAHVNNGKLALAIADWKDDVATGNMANETYYVLGDDLQGKWVHMVATYDADTNTRKLYVNSTLMTTQTGTLGDPNALFAGKFEIGSWSGEAKRNWKGLIDELRIYDRAITEEEAKALAAEGGGVTALPDPTATPEATPKPTQKPTATPTVKPAATTPAAGATTAAAGTATPAPTPAADNGWILYVVIAAVVVAGVVVFIVASKKKK